MPATCRAGIVFHVLTDPGDMIVSAIFQTGDLALMKTGPSKRLIGTVSVMCRTVKFLYFKTTRLESPMNCF